MSRGLEGRNFTKSKENFLKQMYRTNPDTNAFIIEISLDDYSEIFNGWDPSPVKRRDLDPELVGFLEACASDVPLRYPLELQLYMPQEKLDKDKENLSREGIRNNFDFTIHSVRKSLMEVRQKTAVYMIAAFAFMSVGYASGRLAQLGWVTTILTEGISIGGWVFLWEAFSLFFFSGQEIRARLKRYLRFQSTEVVFKYR
ncbi:MAG: hypothetical protein ACM3WU_09410 [Bacillota bacterium]